MMNCRTPIKKVVKTASLWEDNPVEVGLSEERVQAILHSSHSLQFVINAFFLGVFLFDLL